MFSGFSGACCLFFLHRALGLRFGLGGIRDNASFRFSDLEWHFPN